MGLRMYSCKQSTYSLVPRRTSTMHAGFAESDILILMLDSKCKHACMQKHAVFISAELTQAG